MRTNVLDYPRTDSQCKSLIQTDDLYSINQFADTILEVSTLLFESGAHCERINRNVQRISQNSCYDVEMLLSFTAISVSVTNRNNTEIKTTGTKRIKHHGAHFGILADISTLTWQFADKEISLRDLNHSLPQIVNKPRYSIWVVRLFIGVACSSLCLLAGGNWIDGIIALVASSVGLTVRQELIKQNFNLTIAIICSSFITTTIAGMDVLFNFGKFPEAAVATAVLFLIPGVPLINSIIDLLEGYVPTGLARGAFGGFILLCIAVGMFLSMGLIGIDNF